MIRLPHAGFAIALLLALGIGGCQSAKVAKPLTAELAGNDPATQLDFWHTLAGRPLASNDEAFHGILLFLDGKDDAAGYEQRVAAMKDRKLLPAGFAAPADQALTRGDLAVVICRILDIRGGVMMRLTGGGSRYAVKELEFLELYPVSAPHQTFSGSEFVAMIGRIEDYQRGNPASVPAKVMPSEMSGPATQPSR